MTDIDLRSLKAELLQAEARRATAEAIVKETEAEKQAIFLAELKDKEADRLAKPGSRHYRQLNIFDAIVPTTTDIWIAQLEHWERRDPGEPIVVRINSPGGSVLEGFALFDTLLRLRRKGHTITTHGMGMIASMATILMQAGDERVLDANSWFMIHEISSGARGKLSDMEDDLKFTKRLNDRLLDILADRSKLTKAQIQKRWRKTDDWMSAEEAVKLGFADRVE